ncbi:MAG TPA: hypothetical protein VFX86_02355 [Candidatus Saccharimonadales bacterium]|nr:hypothetical protein [Candidatus Saccharimonadales bacterium]
MNDSPGKKPIKKLSLEILERRQDKIISLLHEEQKRAKEKFPLTYAMLATFGLVCTIAGFNHIIAKVDFLNNNPITLIIFGLALLLVTGAAYKKLG